MPGPISQEKIQEHTNLINTLNALDYVPAAQEDNDARLAVINAEIGPRQQGVESLERKTKSEYKDLHKAKSPTRQFFLRLRQGEEAVDQLLKKEHQEYLEAFQAEHNAREKLAILLQEKHEREAAKVDLANKQRTLEEIKEKIQALYEGLFAGPTPDYPEEEAAERQLSQAQSNYHRTQLYFNKHSTALASLIKAEITIRTCTAKVTEARTATENMKKSGVFSIMSEQLVQCSSLLGAQLAAGNAQRLLRDADQSMGTRVYQVVGPLDVIPSAPPSSEWNGERYVLHFEPGFINTLDECLTKLGEARTRLADEIKEAYRRLNERHEAIRQRAVDLQTARKELADIWCQIMIRLTNPATLEARTHISAPNAHEVGDSELPVYFDTKNTAGSPTKDPQGKVSIGVPSYEESQTHTKSVGGFRVELPGSSSQSTASPAYVPQVSMPTPRPGGVGGFRVPPTNGPSHLGPSLKLKIPEPQGSRSPSPTTPVISLASPQLQVAGPSTSSTQPRPNSWSLNPYAAAMVRRASIDNVGLTIPGGWPGNNPFLSLISERVDIDDKSQTEGASSTGSTAHN